MLLLACVAAVAGRLGDMVGHRVLRVEGVLIFGLASLACGFAGSDVSLIAARGVQGIGAAIIFPLSLAMVCGTTFNQPERIDLVEYHSKREYIQICSITCSLKKKADGICEAA